MQQPLNDIINDNIELARKGNLKSIFKLIETYTKSQDFNQAYKWVLIVIENDLIPEKCEEKTIILSTMIGDYYGLLSKKLNIAQKGQEYAKQAWKCKQEGRLEEAIELCEKSMEHNSWSGARCMAGICYEIEEYDMACDMALISIKYGGLSSLDFLAYLIAQGGGQKDGDETLATKVYKIGADAGVSSCEYYYALRLLKGVGIGSDVDSGIRILRKLADIQDNTKAQSFLARMFYSGEYGYDRQSLYVRSMAYRYAKLVYNKDPDKISPVFASCLLEGYGVDRSETLGLSILYGNIESGINLEESYYRLFKWYSYNGNDKPDYEKAFAISDILYKKGTIKGKALKGICLVNGWGEEDKLKGCKLIVEAANQGDHDAKTYIREMVKEYGAYFLGSFLGDLITDVGIGQIMHKK